MGSDRLATARKHLRTKFVYDLIYGNLANMREVWEMLRFLHIDKQPNSVMLICIDNFSSMTANLSQLKKRELRLKVLQMVEKAAEDFDAGMAATVGEDSFVLVFHLDYKDDKQAEREARKLAETVKMKVEKESSTSVSVGIGRRCSDIRSLDLSYQQAKEALEHRFFTGEGQVIYTSDVESFQEKGLSLFSSTTESELVTRVRFGDREGAEEILTEIITKDLFNTGLSPVIIQARCLELVIKLLRTAVEAGIDSSQIAKYSAKYIKNIFESSTFQELSDSIHRLVEDLTKQISDGHSRRNLRVIQRAITFIKEHFNRDLSLEEVARSAGLSSYYFSHIFKKETGTTFIEYLTSVRIEKAKELLANTDLNIAEVARSVGYQDAKYFSRVFKNIVGVPPSKFS